MKGGNKPKKQNKSVSKGMKVMNEVLGGRYSPLPEHFKKRLGK